MIHRQLATDEQNRITDQRTEKKVVTNQVDDIFFFEQISSIKLQPVYKPTKYVIGFMSEVARQRLINQLNFYGYQFE